MHQQEGGTGSSVYEGRVPFWQKYFYAWGGMAETILGLAFSSFNFFFYTNILGLSGFLAGLAVTICLFFDAASDPLVGSISDRWKSRLGRRHPFMLTAPIPVGICLYLIYSPPAGLGDTGLFLWLTVLAIGLRVCMTFYHVPHLALGAELSADFAERSRVMSFNTLFGAFGALICLVTGYSVFFHKTPEFTNGLLNPDAYAPFALTAAIAGGIAMFISSFLTMKVIPRLPVPPPDISRFSPREFLLDVKDALRNENYRHLLFGVLFLAATLGSRSTLSLHMNTYFWELVPEQIRYFALFAAAGPVIGAMSVTRLHLRFGKKNTIVWACFFTSLFAVLPVVLRLIGWFPKNHTPLLFPSLGIVYLLAVTAGIIFTISVMSALADIADEHELNTGRRQEGVFFASRTFFAKAVNGLGHLIAGIALDVINFPAGAEPGTVPADVIWELAVFDGPIAVIPGFLAVIFYRRYSISRKRLEAIQLQLRTNGKNSVSGGILPE